MKRPLCNGHGRVLETASPEAPEHEEICPRCHGSGIVVGKVDDIGVYVRLPDTIYMTSPTMNLRWHCGVLEQMFIASTGETSWQAVPMTGG